MEDFINGVVAISQSDNPFMKLISNISYIISSIWNYSIYTTADKQNVFIGNLVIALLLFIFGFKLSSRLSQHIRKKLPISLDKSTANTLERFSYYLFLIFITIFVLDIANVPLTVFTVVGTTLALGIGLGSQNMANNFISGLIILIEQPIKLGDIIKVKDVIGKVTNIGARCVSIRTPENIILLIPNSNILQDLVINWTHEDSTFKTTLVFTIKKEPGLLIKFEKIIIETLLENGNIIKNPAPKILLKAVTKESYLIEVEFWLDLESNEGTKYIIDQLNRNLDIVFEEQGIIVIEQHEEKPPSISKD